MDHAVTLPPKIAHLLGTWSGPPDVPAKVSLGLAIVFGIMAASGGGRSLLLGFEHEEWAAARRLFPSEAEDYATANRRRFLALAALAAALLSIVYMSSYLLGGPRIIDATTYFLQGRALAHGDFSWSPLEPTASFHGRFLVERIGADGPTLGGIFPPGYPLLLSFGFMVGAPMIVGPLLAAALVVVTYRLARLLAEDAVAELAEPIARAAALLSIFSAALRYHTADTMSHAASALGIALALVCALEARSARRSTWALLAGLAVGYVVATRPTSALPIALVVGWSLASQPRALTFAALGLLPGVGLLLLSQHEVTGAWLTSTQRAYYAASDGPPGCFRWGFGKDTGCVFEHGEFVEARLANGYGIVEAIGVTLRRLWPHLMDVANLEPLALLAVAPALLRRSRASRRVRAATALVGLQILAYAPFYFDGNYPGGGARFFADVLPVEHALVMLGAACIIAGRRPAASREGAVVRGAIAVLALATAGFAIHASYEHGKLRDRDGGPMFDPDALTRAGITRGLVFVGTDHGFALGHDPRVRPDTGVVVARRLNDDRDRMLFEKLQRPTTYLYDLAPAPEGGRSSPSLAPWVPPDRRDVYRFESEAEWPVLSQQNGYAVPAWVHGCAGNQRALVVTPATPATTSGPPARVTFELPVPSAGRWSVEVRVVHAATVPHAGRTTEGEGRLQMGGQTWSWGAGERSAGTSEPCVSAGVNDVDLEPPRVSVVIEATGGSVAVDSITLRSVP